MTTEVTIETVAGEAYGWFTTTQRGDETIVVLKDDAPQWVTDIVYAGHGDNFLPDDWRYDCIQSVLSTISDGFDEDDGAHEFADAHVDVYTAARYAWLSSNLSRQGYIDEAVSEGLLTPSEDIAEMIGIGQYMESQEVYHLVVEALKERVEQLEDEQEEGL